MLIEERRKLKKKHYNKKPCVGTFELFITVPVSNSAKYRVNYLYNVTNVKYIVKCTLDNLHIQ